MADDIVKVPEGVDGDITEVKEVALTEESIVEETTGHLFTHILNGRTRSKPF